MSIVIVCDKGREEPIKWLENGLDCPYELKIEQITVGDYAILKNGKIAISIERKTWTDLASTIKDPKRKANHSKLLKLREETGCSIIYIIEGTAFPSPSHKFSRIPCKNLTAYLHHLVLRDNCAYIQTKNVQHTAETIIQLADSLSTLKDKDVFGGDEAPMATNETSIVEDESSNNENKPSNNENKPFNNENEPSNNENEVSMLDELEETADIPVSSSTNQDTSAFDRLKQRDPLSTNVIIESMLLAVPGITSLSMPIIKKTITLRELLMNDVTKKISELKYISGNKIGPKRASVINNGAKNVVTHKKILASIPGVTDKTANIILNNFTIEYIMDTIKQKELADIIKSTKTKIINGEIVEKKTRLGNALSKKIISIIRSI